MITITILNNPLVEDFCIARRKGLRRLLSSKMYSFSVCTSYMWTSSTKVWTVFSSNSSVKFVSRNGIYFYARILRLVIRRSFAVHFSGSLECCCGCVKRSRVVQGTREARINIMIALLLNVIYHLLAVKHRYICSVVWFWMLLLIFM